ncbi:MAG TPA: hypothetical protein VHV99_23920 [Paraburkholderia sp.]|jgi:hypothetical protein|nr:hypothetical protein [Paraburkholderia sp.]
MDCRYSTGLVREREEEREIKLRALEPLEYLGIARYAHCRTPGV